MNPLKRLNRVAPALAILALLAAAAIAMATPPSGQHPTTPVVATLADSIHVNTDRIKFQTKDSTDFAIFNVTYDAGGYSGWHTHPGIVFVLVQSGAVVRQVGCESRTYNAGETFIESDDQPAGQVRNASATDPAVLSVTQIVPAGSKRRVEADPPNC
jgi:quercetin dioxygenase-like cupin family protein